MNSFKNTRRIVISSRHWIKEKSMSRDIIWMKKNREKTFRQSHWSRDWLKRVLLNLKWWYPKQIRNWLKNPLWKRKQKISVTWICLRSERMMDLMLKVFVLRIVIWRIILLLFSMEWTWGVIHRTKRKPKIIKLSKKTGLPLRNQEYGLSLSSNPLVRKWIQKKRIWRRRKKRRKKL